MCLQICQNAGATVSANNESPECPAKRAKIAPNELTIERTTLWAVPDLCLIQIFHHFELAQLHIAANVCQRFRRIAVTVFRFRYAKQYLQDHSIIPANFVSYLRIFSPLNLRIESETNVRIFGAIAEYCPDLESLSIKRYVKQPHEMAAVRSLLPKLKMIGVKQMDIWNETAAVVDWPLERLSVYHDSGYKEDKVWTSNLIFPKLKRLRLYMGSFVCHSPFYGFLTANGHIEHLEFFVCRMSLCRLRSLAACVPNLRSLTFLNHTISLDDYGSNIAPGGRVFKCLEVATIWLCWHVEFYMDMFVGSPIKHLRVMMLNKDLPIEAFSKLTSVSRLTLRLYAYVPVGYVLEIANSMSGLQELHVYVDSVSGWVLAFLKRLVKELASITKLFVRWENVVDLRSAPELEEIAALIAARPERCVEVLVVTKRFKVGGFFGCTHIDSATKSTSRSKRSFSFDGDGRLMSIFHFTT